MNIFRTSNDPEEAARHHPDVVGGSTQNYTGKMCLEAAQITCDAMRINYFTPEGIYNEYQLNNSLCQWAAESYENFMFAFRMSKALNEEYKRRTGKSKDHGAWETLSSLPAPPAEGVFPQVEATEQPQFFSNYPELQRDDVVKGYRLYMANVKAPKAEWNHVPRPEFIDELQREELLVEPEDKDSREQKQKDNNPSGLDKFKGGLQ